ncbi:hypothetical protein LEMLEM_LOCUS630 [Lemmus lemmus]
MDKTSHDRTFHPPVFQDATMKGLPAPHTSTLIFGDNSFFFPKHLASHLTQGTDA